MKVSTVDIRFAGPLAHCNADVAADCYETITW